MLKAMSEEGKRLDVDFARWYYRVLGGICYGMLHSTKHELNLGRREKEKYYKEAENVRREDRDVGDRSRNFGRNK